MIQNEVLSPATSGLPITKDVNVTCAEVQDLEEPKTPYIDQQNPITFQAWPTQPKALVLAQREQMLYTILDYALIALPVCLIIKTGLCIYAHSKDGGYTGVNIDSVSALSRQLVAFNSQLVTLFTIVFATIVSIFVKRYALWKAQHGAYVADLEQLQGSVSLPSTLKLIWSLRSFGVKSLVLTLVWSFYYLGSQAVKLEYRLSLSEHYHNMDAAIQRSDAPSYFSSNLDSVFEASGYNLFDFKSQLSYLDRLNTNFGSMLLEEQDELEQNLHGNSPNPGTRNGPLVPDYFYSAQVIEQTSMTNKLYKELGGWIDVSKQSQLADSYVSLTGQSLWVDLGDEHGGNNQHYPATASFLGTYTLSNISYINVTCSVPVVRPVSAFPNQTFTNSSATYEMIPTNPNATRDNNGYPLRQLYYWYKLFAADPVTNAADPYPETYNGTLNYTLRALQSTCSLTTRFVDLKVNCITTGCYPKRLRWANNTDEHNATSYSTPFDSDAFAANFLRNYTTSTGPQDSPGFPTMVEYAFGASYAMNASIWSTLGPAKALNFSPTAPAIEDYALTQGSGMMHGFNTYHMLSQSIISDYIQPNMQEILTASTHQDDLFKLVRAHGAPLEQGYRIDWRWVPIDFLACLILLVAAVGAYWLRINTLAPDIFGYVSSLTRDNPHIQLPSEGSALSGIDRARMLKRVKVRIGDVRNSVSGESSVGRVGLAPVNAEVRPLYSKEVYA